MFDFLGGFMGQVLGEDGRLEAAQKQVIELRAENQSLTAKLDEAQRENYSLRRQLGEQKEAVKALSGRVESLQRKKQELTRRINLLKEQYAELEEECRKNQREIVSQQSEGVKESTVTEQSLDDVRIDDTLMLDGGVGGVLMRAGIVTMAELLSKKASELLLYRSLGEVSLNKIVVALARRGLKLSGEDSPKEQIRMDRILLPSRMKMTKVEELGLSLEVYNAVRKAGIEVVADMYDMSYGGRWFELPDDLQKPEMKDEIWQCMKKMQFPYRLNKQAHRVLRCLL